MVGEALEEGGVGLEDALLRGDTVDLFADAAAGALQDEEVDRHHSQQRPQHGVAGQPPDEEHQHDEGQQARRPEPDGVRMQPRFALGPGDEAGVAILAHLQQAAAHGAFLAEVELRGQFGGGLLAGAGHGG